jgi:hypothetical protein
VLWIVGRSLFHQCNALHFAVTCKALVAIVPFNRDVSRLNGSNLADIILMSVKGHARANRELFGLFAGHFFILLLIPVGT